MVKTPAEVLNQQWVSDLLTQPLIARLATANPATLQPHVVPVWFEWNGGAVWISSFDSTRKMRDLEGNPRVSLVIDTDSNGGTVRGVVIEGTAHIISEPTVVAARSRSIYARYLGEEGAREPEPASWVVDPENRIIQITPKWAYVWGG